MIRLDLLTPQDIYYIVVQVYSAYQYIYYHF